MIGCEKESSISEISIKSNEWPTEIFPIKVKKFKRNSRPLPLPVAPIIIATEVVDSTATNNDMEIQENEPIHTVVKVVNKGFKKPSIYPILNLETDKKLSLRAIGFLSSPYPSQKIAKPIKKPFSIKKKVKMLQLNQ